MAKLKVGPKHKYHEWVPLMEMALEDNKKQPMTSKELRQVIGVPDSQQSNLAAILVAAAEREDSRIVYLGWSSDSRVHPSKIWGLREWNLKPQNMEQEERLEQRRRTRARNLRNQKQRIWREQQRVGERVEEQKQWKPHQFVPDKNGRCLTCRLRRSGHYQGINTEEDTRENGKARTPRRDASTVSTVTLGENYRCTGVALEPDGTIVMTLTTQDGNEVRVVQQEG